jgi:hypothetical protein
MNCTCELARREARAEAFREAADIVEARSRMAGKHGAYMNAPAVVADLRAIAAQDTPKAQRAGADGGLDG